MRFRLLFILSFFISSFVILAQENNKISINDTSQQKKQSLAVLEFNGNGIYSIDLCISSVFREEFSKMENFSVIKRSAMNAVFEEAVYPWMDCHDINCAVEIGKILAVQKIVLGTLDKKEKILTLTIQVINVESGDIEISFIEKCENCFKDNLLLKTIQKICLDMANNKTGIMK